MAKFEEVLSLVFKTEGESDVGKLAKSLLDLGKSGAISDEQLTDLVDEVEKLAKATRAAKSVTTLKAALHETGDELFLAKTKAEGLRKELAESEAPTKRLTQSYERAQRVVADLTAKQGRQTAELQRATNVLGAAGLSANKLGDAQNVLRQRVAQTTEGLKAYQRTGSDNVAQTSRFAGALGSLRGALAAIGVTLGLRAAADGIKNLLGLGDAAERAKVQLGELYGSAAQGETAFVKLRQLASDNGVAFDGVREAATKLKAVGLEPLDGTLQALIDQTARLGGSQEALTGIGLALGQMYAKQKVQTEEILQLVERGVPAFELLAKVTGKQGVELQKLIESGKLGRDTIRALIDEIGRSSAGAAAKNLNTLSGLFAQLQDRVRGFFTDVSNAGPLNFFKGQLRGLIDTIDRMTRTGELAAWARTFGTAIANIGAAVAGTVKFIVDYSGALFLLAKAYALIKVQGFLDGIAAVSAGTTKTTGIVRGLATAIMAIPAIRLAVIGGTAVALAADHVRDLARAVGENVPATKALEAATAATMARIREGADFFRLAAERLSEYRDVQVKTAAEVAALGEEERASYAERLAGLQSYLEAQARYFRQLENANALNAEGAQYLADLGVRLGEVEAGFGALGAGAKLAADALQNQLTTAAAKVRQELASIADSTETAKEKLKGAFDDFDRISVTGLGDIALAVQSIGEQSEVAGQRVQSGLGESLSKLSGQDLLRFQDSATAAFDAVGRSGDQTSVVLNTTLSVAMDRLKVDAADTGVAFTTAGRDILATFTAITTNAQATGAQIEAAFTAALGGLKTREEAAALGAALEAATAKGKIGAEAAERAMRELRARVREITVDVDPLSDAFEQLGITSQRALIAARDSAREAFDAIVAGARQGLAAQEDVRAAFEAYAAAERAAAANSAASTQQQVEQKLRLQAVSLGLIDTLKQVGDAGENAGQGIAASFGNAAATVERLGDAASGATQGLDSVAASASGAGQAIQGAGVSLGYMTERAREALSEARGFEQINGVMSRYRDEIFATREELDAFTDAQREAAQAAEDASTKLAELTEQLQRQRDEATLNEGELERKRYERELERIRELEAASNGSASAAASLARGLAEEEHRRRLAEIEAEARARREAESGASSGSGVGAPPSNAGSGQPTPAPRPSGTGGAVNINVTVANVTSPAEMDRFVRDLRNRLTEIEGRS